MEGVRADIMVVHLITSEESPNFPRDKDAIGLAGISQETNDLWKSVALSTWRSSGLLYGLLPPELPVLIALVMAENRLR